MNRLRAATLVAIAVLAAGCTGEMASSSPGEPPDPEDATEGALSRAACDRVEPEVLLRTWRGVDPERSGDIQLIPRFPNFVSGGLTHATPFDYTQDVPVLLYGPGHVRPGVYEEPITLADLAPTAAALLEFPFDAPDGTAQTQSLLPAGERAPPALVVTVVWDSAGDDVLGRWPDSWPYLRALKAEGAWFENATVGASPSNTPVAHATIGTGAFPRLHGLVDEYVRYQGWLQKPNEQGPHLLNVPTLADLYDVAMDNEPKVGTVATLAAHVMMMGHGTQWPGADLDLAITREQEDAETGGAESSRWSLVSDMMPYYGLPEYTNDLPPLSSYVDAVDRADGALDGRWRENDIASLSGGFDTPARTPFQQTLVETVIEREGFGADDVPDLLYVNYKAIDTIGHLFSADGIEMSDAVAAQDAALERFVSFLDGAVGEGRWVMVLAADHGTQRDPDVSGAFPIEIRKLQAGLASTFDEDDDGVSVFQKVRPTQIWMNVPELADNGFTLEQVSGWLLGLTQADTFTNDRPPEAGREDEPVFDAVLPTATLSTLGCLPSERDGTSTGG